MKRTLPAFPSSTKFAVAQIRRGVATIGRAISAYEEISVRLTYYRAGKFPVPIGGLRRIAMKRGKLRRHVERWLGRLDELLVFAVSDELYRAVRRHAYCTEKSLHWCERIPLKGKCRHEDWINRRADVAREIRECIQ